MTKKRIYAFRDPAGVRPLVLGMIGDRYCVASETCAFDIIGAQRLRDVAPGELVSIGEDGIRTRQVVEGAREAFCVFEYIYFARPDSRMGGDVLQAARGRMGEILGARGAGARRPTSSSRCPTPATPPPAASRARPACPRTTGSSRTATWRGPSSSPARSCASTACG